MADVPPLSAPLGAADRGRAHLPAMQIGAVGPAVGGGLYQDSRMRPVSVALDSNCTPAN
jgi:hypothetical protein